MYFKAKSDVSIITQVIIEILALPLAIIFRYNQLWWSEVLIATRDDYSGRQFFKMATLRFVDVKEEEINFMKENAIQGNTKHATKFRMHSSKVRCENFAYVDILE